MGRAERADLGMLAAVWGGSFLFIKVILRDLSPVLLVETRLALGALTIALILTTRERARRGPGALTRARVAIRSVSLAQAAILALSCSVVPFLLIAWAEQRIDSGLAGILNAFAPLLTAGLAARWDRSSRVRGAGMFGLPLGFLGVVVLFGFDSLTRGGSVLGKLAVLAAAACYAGGAVYARRVLVGRSATGVALAQTLTGAVLLAPLAILLGPPDHVPGLEAIGSMLALGVAGTGWAFAVYYSLIARAGSTRAILVTYLQPPTALVLGAVFLHEPVTGEAVAGLTLILAGVFLATLNARPSSTDPG